MTTALPDADSPAVSPRRHVNVTWLRYAAMIEGLSFLVLLGVAMPLKYFADMPMAVKVAGWVHGLLFVIFLMTLLGAASRVPVKWLAATFIASLIPFGPFVVDPHLKRFEIAA